jgi:hypothetical protein
VKLAPIALGLILSLAPAAVRIPVAHADDSTTVAARARFKEGVALAEQGRFEDARAAFLQAYALKKHPDVLLNLADSSLKSGHTLEAERYFSQYLREATDAKPEKRQAAEKGRNEARAKLGRIEVSAPSGTEVTLDGERIGVTPLDGPIYVDPGAHAVKLKGPDGTTDAQSVAVLAGQQGTAKLKAGGGATPTPPSTEPQPPTQPPPPSTLPDGSQPPPPTQHVEPPPPEGDHLEMRGKPGPLSPPKNMFPVFIGGGVAIISFGVAVGVGVIAKGSAQDRANQAASDIRNQVSLEQSRGQLPKGQLQVCGPPVIQPTTFNTACGVLNSDNKDVNTDATIGNIFLGVGIAATVGTLIYYVAAPKKGAEESKPAEPKASGPIVMPLIGGVHGMNGLTISGAF